MPQDADSIAEKAHAEYDPEVVRYMLSGRVPLVVKFNRQQIDAQLGQPLRAGEETGGEARLAEIIESFFKYGPASDFYNNVFQDAWSGDIDPDRASYAALNVLADDAYRVGVHYGAVLQPPWSGPQAHHLRVMLPTKTPQKTAEKIRASLASSNLPGDEHAVMAGERFVILDTLFVQDFATGRKSPLPDWKAVDAPPGDRKIERETPALARFLTSSAPLSAYVRSQYLREVPVVTDSLEGLKIIRQYADPDAFQVLKLQMVGDLLGKLAVSPRSELEHEDTLIELNANANGHGWVFDITNTLTERGRQLASLQTTSRAFSEMPAGAAKSDPLAKMGWNIDLISMHRQFPLSAPLLIVKRGGQINFWPTVYESLMAHPLRDGAGLFLMTPTFFLRQLAPLRDEGLPVAGALEFSAPPIEDASLQDVIAGASIFFTPSPESANATENFILAAERITASLTRIIASLTQQAPEIKSKDASSGQWVSLATNAANTQTIDLAPGEVSINIALDHLLQHPRIAQHFMPEAMMGLAGTLKELRLRTKTAEGVRQTRLQVGSDERELPTVKMPAGFKAQQQAPLCADRLVISAGETFMGLARLIRSRDPSIWQTEDGDIKQLPTALDDYDARAEECAAEHPEIADELKLARARMRGIILAILWAPPESPENLENHWDHLPGSAGPAIEKEACELGDTAFCPAP